MRLGLLIISIVVTVAFAADLPSCSRAKCVHCGVDFIKKMCPAACAQCGSNERPPQPASVYANPVHSANTRYVSSEGGPTANVQNQILNVGPPQPSNQFPNPVQFAAPTSQQQQPLAYPQQPQGVNTATLAPLIEPPRVAEVNQNLASQPADLAQPLPEYSNGQLPVQQPQLYQQQPFYPQQPNIFQQPQPAGYGSQVNNLFGQPFNIPQAQPQTPFLNPFQPFLQQTNAFDPLNMFNLNNNLLNQQPQNTPQQLQQPFQAQPYQNGQVQHQGNYNPYPQQAQAQPQFQQYQQQLPQQPQQPNFQQPAQQTYQQPAQPTYQQPAQPAQQTYQQPSQPTYQQPQPQAAPQPQLAQVSGGAQQHFQQQPQPLISKSIDSHPQKVEKYVDTAKGQPLIQPAPAAAAPQCPRQPGWQPCITKETANTRFQSCCQRLGEGCAPLCNYDATLATMQLAVLTGRCPLGKVGDVMICASGYEDVSQCCEAYGVFEPGYEHCRPYCNPAAGLPSGGLLSEKYKCLVKLQHIQQCFFVSQKP